MLPLGMLALWFALFHLLNQLQDQQDVEIHTVTDIDPVQSYNANKAHMAWVAAVASFRKHGDKCRFLKHVEYAKLQSTVYFESQVFPRV